MILLETLDLGLVVGQHGLSLALERFAGCRQRLGRVLRQLQPQQLELLAVRGFDLCELLLDA